MTKLELQKLTTKELKDIRSTIKLILWERFKIYYRKIKTKVK